jgi:hypothetical protein
MESLFKGVGLVLSKVNAFNVIEVLNFGDV